MRMTKPALVAVVTFALHGSSAARDNDPTGEKRGEVLVTRYCARCHSIERSRASFHPDAPPFTTLGRRYPIEALEEALGEGISSGHRDMPQFRFTGPDVGAIIAFLKSIQEP
jgi:mono/diheme cytochrome c family protein